MKPFFVGDRVFYFCKNSLYCFNYQSRFRQACVYIAVTWYHRAVIMLVVFFNCVIMASKDFSYRVSKDQTYVEPDWIDIGYKVCAATYIVEFIIKVIARGYVLDEYSYLRDPWRWISQAIVIFSLMEFALIGSYV